MRNLNSIGERRRRQMRLNYFNSVNNKNKKENTAGQQETKNVGNSNFSFGCNSRLGNKNAP